MAPDTDTTGDAQRPPLPPRPSTRSSVDPKALQAQTTTAVTPIEIQTLSFPDGTRGTFSTSAAQSISSIKSPLSSRATSPGRRPSPAADDVDDKMSVNSFAPSARPAGDIASLLAGELNQKSAAVAMLQNHSATLRPFDPSRIPADDVLADFAQEFRDLPDEGEEPFKDDDRLVIWKSKLKHYMVLSSAGKPIWSRHGDLNLINSSIGVVQTIISFYEGARNPLQSFKAGNTQFVILTQGSLYFIAISKLGESVTQLRAQLEALYMQILSTLTLPTLTKIFVNRPSSDLSTPLRGTESLLSSLADNFTKGSPSALLGSLECLRLRKSQRNPITNTFLKHRSPKLLYGLIVAGGRLVSVIRPRKHSLHPTDLQLIFNMLFESGGVKVEGAENWIPLCLPAFNNQGYLYMYVSFFENADQGPPSTGSPEAQQSTQGQIAMILVSTDRDSFYDLQQMRNTVAESLDKAGSLAILRDAVKAGRPQIPQIASGSQLSHFLYKSRSNVQFCMSSLEPAFRDAVDRRRLLTAYHDLHSAVHAKHAHLKVLHKRSDDVASLVWITPIFEFYGVAGPNPSRAALTQGANKIIQWVKREEERLFIVGGGVF